MDSFADRLVSAIKDKRSHLLVGLDPRLDHLPPSEVVPDKANPKEQVAQLFFEAGRQLVTAVAEHAVGIKPQIAFYEQYGQAGFHALERTVEVAKAAGLLVLLDAKRGDIGSTAEAYAAAYLGKVPVLGGSVVDGLDVDAMTVSPYQGNDSLEPFKTAMTDGKGIFVVIKSSNPSSSDIQDLAIGSELVYERVAEMLRPMVQQTIGKSGYSSVGAVVGATFPGAASRIRNRIRSSYFLVPGVGPQGGSIADVSAFFDEAGLGAIISASREIMLAYRSPHMRGRSFSDAARLAARDLKDAINACLAEEGKIAWG